MVAKTSSSGTAVGDEDDGRAALVVIDDMGCGSIPVDSHDFCHPQA